MAPSKKWGAEEGHKEKDGRRKEQDPQVDEGVSKAYPLAYT